MNYNKYLTSLGESFIKIITQAPNVQEIPTQDYGWNNFRYQSDWFRLAHVERYWDRNMEVLHVTTFPHKWSPEPIFGFDLITTKSSPIGCYIDLSPIVNKHDFNLPPELGVSKPVPEWASVFSDNFVLINPLDLQQVEQIAVWGLELYRWYLLFILASQQKVEEDREEEVRQKQNKYCQVQSTNPKTLSALKLKLGQQKAEEFMNTILFPEV